MSDDAKSRYADSLTEGLGRVLGLLKVRRAQLQIGTRTWAYEIATGRFIPGDVSDALAGPALAFRDGTLSLPEPLDSVSRQTLDLFLHAVVEAARNRVLLEIIFKTDHSLSTNLNLNSLLVELMALTRQALGTDVGSVMLLDATKTKLYWELAEGDEAGVFQTCFLPVGEGIAGRVAQTGEPIIVTDAQQDPRVARWVDETTAFKTRSILCVPIRFKGEVIGVLQVLNKTEGAFTEDDRELLDLIAAEAGVAIENERLYGTLEERVSQRTRELTEANQQLSQTLVELKATQTQLVQSEKMASLGKLVAGVAHEINTPLGAITSNTDTLIHGFRKVAGIAGAQDESLIAMLTPLLQINAEACGRINTIVKNLRKFARLDEAEWKRVDLREGMESTLALVHHLHKGRIEIIREYGNIPLVECHPSQLNQVFMNLLVNAIQAIEGPGQIWIRMSARDNGVMVEVQDTGCGIGEEHLPKIFDPGFTTKGVGVGTGLGLSICYQIVAAHKGSIHVTSQKGMGAIFTLKLPVRPGA